MKLPIQAKPVVRNVSTARIMEGMSPSDRCDVCDSLAEPAKSMCWDICSS